MLRNLKYDGYLGLDLGMSKSLVADYQNLCDELSPLRLTWGWRSKSDRRRKDRVPRHPIYFISNHRAVSFDRHQMLEYRRACSWEVDRKCSNRS